MTRWLYSVLWPLGKACLLFGLARQVGDLKTAVAFLALSRPQRQGCQDAAAAEGLRGALYLRSRGSAAPGAPLTFLLASAFQPRPAELLRRP